MVRGRKTQKLIGYRTQIHLFAGLSSGCGVTHTAIMAAEYLSKVKGLRTAYVEMNQSHQIRSLQSLYGPAPVKTGNSQKDSFLYHGVEYFPEFRRMDLQRVYSMEYEAIVIDCGICMDHVAEKISGKENIVVVADSSVWKTQILDHWLETLRSKEQETRYCLLPFGTEKEVKRINQTHLAKACDIPFTPNPFQITPSVIKRFEAVLYR